MNLSEIKRAFRSDTADAVAPYLWSDSDIVGYANDGERESCRRGRLIIDSSDPMCTLSAASGSASVSLDNRIISIRRVRVTGQLMPLFRSSWRDMDELSANWESHTGRIERFITDWQTGKLRLYRIPTVDSTLNLTVVRLPLNDMAFDSDEPEINPRYHLSLLNWIKYRAYSKQDAETKNEQLAAKYLALFEEEFGKRSSAVDEEWIEREQQYDPFDGTK